MNTYEDILARVKAGEDPMTIANEFADALNKAVAEKNEAEDRARRDQEKIDLAQDIIDRIGGFIRDFYPEIWNDDLKGCLTGKDLVEMVDEAIAHVNELKAGLNLVGMFAKNDNDPIAKFLADNHLS